MSVNIELREDLPESALVFDNPSYDGAIIGTTTEGLVVYDYYKMIEELMRDEEMTEEEAVDWIDYNTIRSLPYAGSSAPIIMYSISS